MRRYHGETVEPPAAIAMTLRWSAALHDQIRRSAERHDRSLAAARPDPAQR